MGQGGGGVPPILRIKEQRPKLKRFVVGGWHMLLKRLSWYYKLEFEIALLHVVLLLTRSTIDAATDLTACTSPQHIPYIIIVLHSNLPRLLLLLWVGRLDTHPIWWRTSSRWWMQLCRTSCRFRDRVSDCDGVLASSSHRIIFWALGEGQTHLFWEHYCYYYS